MADPESHIPPEADRWRVPDELWMLLEPLFTDLDPPKHSGRKRHEAREVLDAILYRAVTGAHWNQLPDGFPADSSVHRTYQRWQRLGIMDRVWGILLEQYWRRDAPS